MVAGPGVPIFRVFTVVNSRYLKDESALSLLIDMPK